MRKAIIVFAILIIFTSYYSPMAVFADASDISITAESAILIDDTTGDILYEKNPDKEMYPASTTKIMTALLVLEKCKLDEKVIIDRETTFVDGSSISSKDGEEFTVDQLLHALMIESANDSAVALAKHVSGNTEDFVKLMNKRAAELGATNTRFHNPNGLPDPEHLTTAHDLARIASFAMTIPKFRELVKTQLYQIPPTNKVTVTRYMKNHNRFLWAAGGSNTINYRGKDVNIKYDIVDGIKTGYTDAAGNCLVSSAYKDNRRLIAVVLKTKGTDVYLDSRTLLDYGFEQFKVINLADKGQLLGKTKVEDGELAEANLVAEKGLSKTVPLSFDVSNIKKDIILQKGIKAPILKGQKLGKIVYSAKEGKIGELELVASDAVAVKSILGKVNVGAIGTTKVVLYTAAIIAAFCLLRFAAIARMKKRKSLNKKLLRKIIK